MRTDLEKEVDIAVEVIARELVAYRDPKEMIILSEFLGNIAKAAHSLRSSLKRIDKEHLVYKLDPARSWEIPAPNLGDRVGLVFEGQGGYIAQIVAFDGDQAVLSRNLFGRRKWPYIILADRGGSVNAAQWGVRNPSGTENKSTMTRCDGLGNLCSSGDVR
jgi:hypothetical protein